MVWLLAAASEACTLAASCAERPHALRMSHRPTVTCSQLTQLPGVQANKAAVIQGKECTYPAITAEQFVREQLAAIYVKAEA